MKIKNDPGGMDALSLFPGLFARRSMQEAPSENEQAEVSAPSQEVFEPLSEKSSSTGMSIPQPPDLSWLMNGEHDNAATENTEAIPSALILSNDDRIAGELESTFTQLGYRIEDAASATEAIAKLTWFDFAIVALDTGFESSEDLESSTVHRFMATMPMEKRRVLYYLLVGPELHTLYNLQALALSANLVVNIENIKQLPLILRKSLQDFEELFAPLLQSLEQSLKR